VTTRLLLPLLFVAGCIKAPDVILVDRKTALEQQAAGAFRPIDEALERELLSQQPAGFTRGQLEESGQADARDALAAAESDEESDAGRLDALLLRRCAGEALDGTVVERPETCAGPREPQKTAQLLERANRNRFQVWRALQKRSPGRSLDEVRRAWREAHLLGVECGAPVQRADGGWEQKTC